ncbi:MAG TPA: hypothetical protein VNT01_17305 [Symbiobacteriaceae bacterium]|nr:hypothetical protein [Symbiobacteriaceae bacterium]
MHQDRERLLADMQSANDSLIVEAAKALMEIGEYGSPAGTYLLAGGQAALRLRRLADAVVLLYHGLLVAEPNTLVWAEILVNRAIACSRHGFYHDAITAGEEFLAVLEALPSRAQTWVPHTHHAIGLAYDRLQQYSKAVPHHRIAAEMYPDPVRHMYSTCDLAYSLALSGDVPGADQVLSTVVAVDEATAQFVFHSTTALVRYHQGRYSEAVAAGDRADSLATGNEEAWALPHAELRYWLSRATWETGDRYRAAKLGLYAALVAHHRWHLTLRDAANAWLAEMLSKGGILNA